MALRVEVGGRVVAYTGDGEWTDELAKLGADADLLIAECYAYAKPIPWHLNYPVLAARVKDCGARRLILTHMSQEMLAHAGGVPEECAHDGLVVTV
jgi:ribonuclease BN (tRNA processing enzyme)